MHSRLFLNNILNNKKDLHPETGVDPCQDKYQQIAKAIGFDTSTNAVPLSPSLFLLSLYPPLLPLSPSLPFSHSLLSPPYHLLAFSLLFSLSHYNNFIYFVDYWM